MNVIWAGLISCSVAVMQTRCYRKGKQVELNTFSCFRFGALYIIRNLGETFKFFFLLTLLGNSPSNISIMLQMFVAAIEMFCSVHLNCSDSTGTLMQYSCGSETAAGRQALPNKNATLACFEAYFCPVASVRWKINYGP